jgi:hypothetical protein
MALELGQVLKHRPYSHAESRNLTSGDLDRAHVPERCKFFEQHEQRRLRFCFDALAHHHGERDDHTEPFRMGRHATGRKAEIDRRLPALEIGKAETGFGQAVHQRAGVEEAKLHVGR